MRTPVPLVSVFVFTPVLLTGAVVRRRMNGDLIGGSGISANPLLTTSGSPSGLWADGGETGVDFPQLVRRRRLLKRVSAVTR